MASFGANFILSKALLVHMFNFGLDLPIFATCATSVHHIIQVSTQNRLVMLQTTTKITPSYFFNLIKNVKLTNEIKT
jgi:hypothetical protein